MNMPTPARAAYFCTPSSRHGGTPMPSGLFRSLNDIQVSNLGEIIGREQQIFRGENLYLEQAKFKSLFLIRIGHFKTFHSDGRGTQQITGFPMVGDLLGIDAIGAGVHSAHAVALEDSLVCEIPYSQLEYLFAKMPVLLLNFHRILSQEIIRGKSAMFAMCNMRAEQRLAAFLIDLSSRYALLGYSPRHFYLRMSRHDIANSLGLTIESVSRLLSYFVTQGLIKVNGRELEILDIQNLQARIRDRQPVCRYP